MGKEKISAILGQITLAKHIQPYVSFMITKMV